MAVVGESGSGKSTAARVITGLLPPREGRVLFNGEDIPAYFRSRSKTQLRKAQMIYQMADTALNPQQKIGEIIGRPVEFYLGLRGKAATEKVGHCWIRLNWNQISISIASHQNCLVARNSA